MPKVIEEWRQAVCDPLHDNRDRGFGRRSNLTLEDHPEPEEAAQHDKGPLEQEAADMNRPQKNNAATLLDAAADEPVVVARFANAAFLPTLREKVSVRGNTKASLVRFNDSVQQKSKNLRGLLRTS